MVCGNIFKTLSIPKQNSYGAEILRECSSHNMYHVSPVPCHVSCVMCHLSPVIFHCFCFCILKKSWKSRRASRWRVCYQRGLPHLFFLSFLFSIFAIFPEFKITFLWCIITPIGSMKHRGHTFRKDKIRYQNSATMMICFRFWLFLQNFKSVSRYEGVGLSMKNFLWCISTPIDSKHRKNCEKLP